MAEMQNSNPTILSIADLPTRHQPASVRKPGSEDGSIFASYLPYLADSSDPFAVVSQSSSDAGSEDGDLMEEPIDEQEIFGML